MSDRTESPQSPSESQTWPRRLIVSRRIRLACYLVFVAGYAGHAMFRDLAVAPMVGDELHFAEIIDQMHADGDWIYPKHASGTPYLNKPPLYFWISTLTYDAFGEGRFKYRFWSASFGVCCALLTVLLGARLFSPEVGGLAGWLLAENDVFLINHGARIGVFDAMLTFFALVCFWLYWTVARRRGDWKGWLLIGIAAAGISMLKPGFGIPFVGVVSLHYLWIGPRWIDVRRLRGPILAALVSLVIVAPWYALQWERYGETYTNAIFWANYIHRADGTLHPDHVAPAWFYIETMSLSSFRAFVPAITCCIILAFWGRKRRALRFSLFVMLSTVALFSLAKCKLPWYVFPVYPLAAILISVPTIWFAKAILARSSLMMDMIRPRLAGALLPRVRSAPASPTLQQSRHS